MKSPELRAYETYIPPGNRLTNGVFAGVLVVVCGLFFMTGWRLWTMPVSPRRMDQAQARHIRTTFMLQPEPESAPKPEQKPDPPSEKEQAREPEKKEVVDLSEKPELAREKDDIRPEKKEKRKRKKVRRVYGVKKVYSRGIGTGGSAADAVVGKYGNTTDKAVDTVAATREELKGELASVTTVTSAPRVKKKPRIEYTEHMREHKVEGVIRARVLVDVDGKVKKIVLLNDLGHGSAQQARTVCKQMEFIPAMRGKEPVATWIIIPIRFELLST